MARTFVAGDGGRSIISVVRRKIALHEREATIAKFNAWSASVLY